MEMKTIEINFESSADGQEASGDGWEVRFENGCGYLWAAYGHARAGSEISLTARGIPGSLPTSACATEWDVMNTRPRITDAVIELRSVQRSEGEVRVIARNASDRDLHVVIGVIFPVEAAK
jgi:hypothetical protein